MFNGDTLSSRTTYFQVTHSCSRYPSKATRWRRTPAVYNIVEIILTKPFRRLMNDNMAILNHHKQPFWAKNTSTSNYTGIVFDPRLISSQPFSNIWFLNIIVYTEAKKKFSNSKPCLPHVNNLNSRTKIDSKLIAEFRLNFNYPIIVMVDWLFAALSHHVRQ